MRRGRDRQDPALRRSGRCPPLPRRPGPARRAAPEESTIPFGPLADTLRGARRADPALWTAVGQRADLLSAMLPELGPGGTADLPVLFEALLDAVEESTPGERPTLWVLDDLHWADEATWQFIRYAARRVTDMSLLLVITYRDEEIDPASPRWTGLVRLKREAHVCTCPLTRLGPADAARLTETHAPTADPAVRARIVERSAGTPLLIEELARLSAGNGDLPEIPDVVRATARAQAAALRPEEHELLEVAAVGGPRGQQPRPAGGPTVDGRGRPGRRRVART